MKPRSCSGNMYVTSLAAIQSREELAMQVLHPAPQALVVQALLQLRLTKRMHTEWGLGFLNPKLSLSPS